MHQRQKGEAMNERQNEQARRQQRQGSGQEQQQGSGQQQSRQAQQRDVQAGAERLLRLERMMTDAYDAALGKMQERRLIETLGPFREHHQRNAQTLQDLASRSEAQAVQMEPEFKRYVQEVLETIHESVRRDQAVAELRIAEAALNMVYAQVLSQTRDEQAAHTIKECMKGEAEHLGALAMAQELSKT